MAESRKQTEKAREPGNVGQDTTQDLDRLKQEAIEEIEKDPTITGKEDPGEKAKEVAKTAAEREKGIPKQPGHLDTREPDLQDIKDKS